MKFLIFDHHSSFSPDIISFLNEKEAAISYINSRPRNYYYDPVFRKEVIQNIEETNPDIVFSIHFFPILSNICRQQKIPYVCWCYNDPLNLLLLHNSVTNNCNIIFHTDSQWIEKLQRLGCQQVHYLPWAADSAYLSTSPDRFSSQADVVCLDSVTPEIHTAYNKLLLQTDPVSYTHLTLPTT